MKNVDELIASSIETGEVLVVRYNGGSQLGTIREIVPIEINGNKLQAKCLTSKSTKTFVIEKLEILDKATSTSDKSWSSEPRNIKYADLQDVFNIQGEALKALGWYVKLEDDILSLHRYSGKGIPLKGADILLEFNRYSYDAVVDFQAKVPEVYAANLRPRKNPWTLRAPDMNTKVFGDLGKAVVVLLEQAAKLSPLS